MRTPPNRGAFGRGIAPTIGAAVQGAEALLRGKTSSPRLDAELLFAFLLKHPREFVIAHRDEPVHPKISRAFSSLVRRHAEGVPLPYLTGTVEFHGRPFFVSPTVMIPRPESEAVIDGALKFLDERPLMPRAPSPVPHPVIADIGTGSGALAVSIAAEVPRVHVVVTDISETALAVARRNARRYRVAARMSFIKSDLLTEIPSELAPTLIVANLPYLTEDELKRAGDSLDTRGIAFEPQKALDGGPDGLFVIRRFFAQLKRSYSLLPTPYSLTFMILEHSPAQRRRILELAHGALPAFRPREVSPFVTSWTQSR